MMEKIIATAEQEIKLRKWAVEQAIELRAVMGGGVDPMEYAAAIRKWVLGEIN